MPSLPRIQLPGDNYHVVTRGEGRRKLFHDQGHYESWGQGLVYRAWTVHRIWSAERDGGTKSPRGGVMMLQILNGNGT
ncbi:hypothetical protein RMSM_03061 [Rhodopirellula maiorica SM1]|uniref:Uncharacterized protein n=1 Tax=Rhodopirellula maiorica SM1 TaxID=1265738 RepID=M5RL08_9BACT|nr:hypothetical protein [Rhodopirellula maiorica]EMI20013.1 hypothetical protein RMSM_03061 [Rhodopirellula maiorica SM1]